MATMKRVAVYIAMGFMLLACPALAIAKATHASLLLEAGHLGRIRWSLSALPDPDHDGRVCLRIALSHTAIPFGDGRCADLREEPNTFAIVDEVEHPTVRLLALAFPSDINRVRLTFGGAEKPKWVWLRRIGPARGARLEVGPFRFRAFVRAGGSCISRLEAFRAVGGLAYDSGGMRCGTSQAK